VQFGSGDMRITNCKHADVLVESLLVLPVEHHFFHRTAANEALFAPALKSNYQFFPKKCSADALERAIQRRWFYQQVLSLDDTAQSA
jgi:hypothetical protein